ncbi:hypothetical protein M1P56_09900 [Streptomyces sp. HU2014]|uniref:hypothetical protein n=1 Tax=Streptomyces sp. HU2014 TaxID=2939414 RepID=UPI0020104DD2|nr:hypothetical protein [Streptomyces sp. HU2014]UQI44638.1 hypothetical protein M1P56_09900 [Streptomyces sp. HU2014]
MSTAQQHGCNNNHRVYEVVIVFEAAVIVGFLAGVLMVALGMSSLPAVCVGGGAAAAVFTAGIAAFGYIHRQN